MIYNLTTHICPHIDVETEPRLEIMCDPRNYKEVSDAVKKIASEIPRKSKVLIGGHVQLVSMLLQVAKIKKWEVYTYSSYDEKVYPAMFFSRVDRLQIEREE